MIIDYDKHSLILNGEKILIKSAAFHYFRSPGAEIWLDRLSKIKACGYNAVDLYFCWRFHSKNQGEYDFTGIRDIRNLLNTAKELGLFVIARPGPFINAEISLGGLPDWLLNIPNIAIRNKINGDFVYSEPYMDALREWYSQIIPIINEFDNIIAFQIENEYYTNEAEPDYLQELYDLARNMGVKAPIVHNDALSVGIYSELVDIYAFDTYPTINMDFDWKNFPDAFGVLDNAEENLGDCKENSPLFVAELQAGWFDKWGGEGYDKIWKLFQKEHINIVTKTALSQGITMFNHYMGCGGTSWGNLACAEVYTSYDFAAPVSECGIPRENYYKAKEINTFLSSFNLACTDLSKDIELFEEENLFLRLRNDNINSCKWLFARNLTPDIKSFPINNDYTLNISPFDMKILPLELELSACKIDFSSFEIFGRTQNEDYEAVLMIISENSEIFISNFDSAEKFYAKTEDIQDFTSFKFNKNNKITEIIFISPDTADKTWILDGKIISGVDFFTANSKKAAICKDKELKILDLSLSPLWKTKTVKYINNENIPELKDWTTQFYGNEIDLDYDYSGWKTISKYQNTDTISNKAYSDYVWYKTSLNTLPEKIEIEAKHCYAVYLDGKQIFSFDSLSFEHGKEVFEKMCFNINTDFPPKKSYELTVLIQNMGFDKGFQNELAVPRGITSLKTYPEQEIEWSIREELFENKNANSQNTYIPSLNAQFDFDLNSTNYNPLFLDLSQVEFKKADICLNNVNIGRFWKNKSPQTKFYLPEEFIKPKNSLAIIIWDRETSTNNVAPFKIDETYVKIKIGNIKSFNLIPLEEILAV